MTQTAAGVDQNRSLTPKGLTGFPVIGRVARNRGAHYIISWLQRISGLGLAAYLALHLYTLTSLGSPESFKAAMALYGHPSFRFSGLGLVRPVGFSLVQRPAPYSFRTVRFSK